MSELKGACIFGQSGGPTSVINASAYGVIATALKNPSITRVLGAEHGIKGVLNDRLFDMGQEDPAELELLKYTPSSALGSCRYKMADPDVDDTDYKRILEIFKKYDVRYFFYNGGNDSMDTCNKISKYMQKVGYECRVMGVPKTIDNDLFGTDHCPGFASAAKYIATSCMEVYQDARVYDTGMVCIIEIMGRHAGWLAGAASLAKGDDCDGPDLILMPEVPFDPKLFLRRVDRLQKQKESVIIAASEGVKDREGRFLCDLAGDGGTLDAFGHKAMLSGTSRYLAGLIQSELGCKSRAIELSTLQRCAGHLASRTDISEAYRAGGAAVQAALEGRTGCMAALKRLSDQPYLCGTELVDVQKVANAEKTVPLEWIEPDGMHVNAAFEAYARPLIQGELTPMFVNGVPRHITL